MSRAEMRFPNPLDSRVRLTETGTAAISGWSGSSAWRSRYRRRLAVQAASTTSFSVPPSFSRIHSSAARFVRDQATMRSAPMGPERRLLGAKGEVSIKDRPGPSAKFPKRSAAAAVPDAAWVTRAGRSPREWSRRPNVFFRGGCGASSTGGTPLLGPPSSSRVSRAAPEIPSATA